jgi:hypothetical protein
MRPSDWIYIALLALLLGGCSTTQKVTQAPQQGTGGESRTEQRVPMYSDKAYRELVRKYTVDDGEKVDYEAWKANEEDMRALDQHIELIARVSPANHPEQFKSRSSKRSYWINSYNALVLHAVLEYWPLDSVRDVRISFSSRVVPGKGFFYDRKITVGGVETSLYQMEKEVLANQKDPRLHFALNCGSESCPVLRPWEWNDEDLDQAARDFVNNPENVAVEDDKLMVSAIFKWYKKDFPSDLNIYLQQFADPDLLADLQKAHAQGFPVKFREYDWSLNADASQT